ncbi:MAG: hypothetical protein ACP5XB_03960 [Isosphaeraceae bacterium]
MRNPVEWGLRMQIDEIRRAKDQRPLRPFVIRMADGNEIRITHPDAVAWGESDNPRVLTAISGPGRYSVEVALITAIDGIRS